MKSRGEKTEEHTRYKEKTYNNRQQGKYTKTKIYSQNQRFTLLQLLLKEMACVAWNRACTEANRSPPVSILVRKTTPLLIVSTQTLSLSHPEVPKPLVIRMLKLSFESPHKQH